MARLVYWRVNKLIRFPFFFELRTAHEFCYLRRKDVSS